MIIKIRVSLKKTSPYEQFLNNPPKNKDPGCSPNRQVKQHLEKTSQNLPVGIKLQIRVRIVKPP